MKHFFSCFALILVISCGKPTETNSTEVYDSVDGGGDSSEAAAILEEDKKEWTPKLERFLSDFEVIKDGYPFISFTEENGTGSTQVEYYFEDENLMWTRSIYKNAGLVTETYYVSRDPEETWYLHYGPETEGAFGFVGQDGGDSYAIKVDEHNNPYINDFGTGAQFEWESEYEDVMNVVRANRDKFKLNDGLYTYAQPNGTRTRNYQFSEVLFKAHLLSPTRFNADMIQGYLNSWYPLYDSGGTYYRRKLCSGTENYIKLTVEAGNYRWEEEASGEMLVYLIKGFEESEGDAFYATIERGGNRFKKTLIKPEFEDGPPVLLIDGRTYTAEPDKYKVVGMKCD